MMTMNVSFNFFTHRNKHLQMNMFCMSLYYATLMIRIYVTIKIPENGIMCTWTWVFWTLVLWLWRTLLVLLYWKCSVMIIVKSGNK